MTAHALEGSFLSQRASVLGAIITLHVLAIYLLSSGLGRRAIELIAPPIEVELIQKIEPREEPPPPAEPQLETPRIQIPRPDINIRIPVETPTALTNVTTEPVPVHVFSAPATVAPPAPRIVVHANVGKNFPNPDDFYPPASIRMEEQGAVGVRVCIGPNGKLAEAPLVARTSGFARLDEAAVKLARVGNYRAGSINGAPTTECLQLPIRFHMRS